MASRQVAALVAALALLCAALPSSYAAAYLCPDVYRLPSGDSCRPFYAGLDSDGNRVCDFIPFNIIASPQYKAKNGLTCLKRSAKKHILAMSIVDPNDPRAITNSPLTSSTLNSAHIKSISLVPGTYLTQGAVKVGKKWVLAAGVNAGNGIGFPATLVSSGAAKLYNGFNKATGVNGPALAWTFNDPKTVFKKVAASTSQSNIAAYGVLKTGGQKYCMFANTFDYIYTC